MLRWREHEYNFTYQYRTAILDDDNADDAIYAPYDHYDDGEYPFIHHDAIIEPYISGVDYNINDENADKTLMIPILMYMMIPTSIPPTIQMYYNPHMMLKLRTKTQKMLTLKMRTQKKINRILKKNKKMKMNVMLHKNKKTKKNV